MVRVRPMVDDDAKYIVEFNQGTDENFCINGPEEDSIHIQLLQSRLLQE